MKFAVYRNAGLWSVVDLQQTRSVTERTRISALQAFFETTPGPENTEPSFLGWWSRTTPQVIEFRTLHEASDIDMYMKSIEGAHQKELAFEVHFLNDSKTAPQPNGQGDEFYDILMSEDKS